MVSQTRLKYDQGEPVSVEKKGNQGQNRPLTLQYLVGRDLLEIYSAACI